MEIVRVDGQDNVTSLQSFSGAPLLAPFGATPGYGYYDVLASFATPLWGNGYAAGYAVEVASTLGSVTASAQLALRYTASVSTNTVALRSARWALVG
jgi:hypothetical protein